jgi:hypothetical protein
VDAVAALALLPAEAAVPLHAEAAVVELPRRAEMELPRRAEAAYALTVRQEACDCREASRCSLQG